MPNAPNLVIDAALVRNDERYKIRDLQIKSKSGHIVATLSQTVLHPGMETRGHSHEDQEEYYFFEYGMGIMEIDSDKYAVTTGSVMYVEAGAFHKVINLDKKSDLVFNAFFKNIAMRPAFSDSERALFPGAFRQ